MRFFILVGVPVALAFLLVGVWYWHDQHLLWLWMSGLMLTVASLGGIFWYVCWLDEKGVDKAQLSQTKLLPPE